MEDKTISQIIQEGLEKHKSVLKTLLISSLEEFYGGPAKWPTGISPKCEDDEGALLEVWNAAIEQAVNKVKEL